ncbi:hypothetical protein G7054_g2157 [Neopestalotiopsis clavispora]|nr:hypothetical protein G7054_g2157 [Neopestalotiopsis clavispora]
MKHLSFLKPLIKGRKTRSSPARSSTTFEPTEPPLNILLRKAALISASDGGREFVPLDKLNELINKASIQSEFDKVKIQSRLKDNLTEWILDNSKRIFATLVMINKTEMIEGIVHSQLTDRDLPLGVDDDSRNFDPTSFVVRSYESNSDTFDKTTKWTVFKDWDIYDIDSFCYRQWRFLAPVFTQSNNGLFFHKACPLPFVPLPSEEQEVKFSHHSRVVRVCIHEAHFKSVKTGGNYLAIKELNPNDDNEKSPEAETLFKLNGLNNDHLIKCITTYQQGKSHYVVFPWAEGGNLREFWATQSKAPRDIHLVMWTLRQMLGLANALKQLHIFTHEQNCRHGDLKPENILHFREAAQSEYGTLVISDLGSATIHQERTLSRGAWTGTNGRYGTFRYEPPEVQDRGPRSRRWDVWSMGCIYLEFFIWLLYGWNKLNSFYEGLDRYWLGYFDRVEVHPRVREHIESMGSDSRCQPESALGDLLEVIHHSLLRVEHGTDDDPPLEAGTGGISPKNGIRADAMQLSKIMGEILEKADKNPAYAYQTSSWESPKIPEAESPARLGPSDGSNFDLKVPDPGLVIISSQKPDPSFAPSPNEEE